jgi:hypothetical protein
MKKTIVTSYKVIFIDSTNRTVTTRQCSSLKDLQALVGGYIESAHRFNNEDDLYVNDEGLMGKPEFFFLLKGANHPLAGNGIIVGCDDNGSSTDHKTSIGEISSTVSFFTRLEVSTLTKRR